MPQIPTSTTKLASVLDFNIGEKAQNILPMIGENNSDSDAYRSNFSSLLTSLMGFIMAIAALAVLLYLLMGAVEWITSGGDKNKLESARNKMMHAALGIIVLSATTAIFMVIQQFVGIQVINFSGQSNVNPPSVYECLAPSDFGSCGKFVNLSNCSNCRGPARCCQIN